METLKPILYVEAIIHEELKKASGIIVEKKNLEKLRGEAFATAGEIIDIFGQPIAVSVPADRPNEYSGEQQTFSRITKPAKGISSNIYLAESLGPWPSKEPTRCLHIIVSEKINPNQGTPLYTFVFPNSIHSADGQELKRSNQFERVVTVLNFIKSSLAEQSQTPAQPAK